MIGEEGITASRESEIRTGDVIYKSEKDFYRGIGGELRLKAEGLFKKAKEKGISIEDISIITLRENKADFPGIGEVELPAYVIKVKGKDIQSGQVIMDGKHIDYFNRYKKYMSEKIEYKNLVRDDKGKIIREKSRPKIKDKLELSLTEWELFEIGKSLVEDKEFGLEKTITGACDRIIRKLMGENDWLYPEEARMLDEEFDSVQSSILKEQESRKSVAPVNQKKATERQINYLKARIKNMGMDPEDERVIREIMQQLGFGTWELSDLTTVSMSKVIDSIGDVIPKLKEVFDKAGGRTDKDNNQKLN